MKAALATSEARCAKLATVVATAASVAQQVTEANDRVATSQGPAAVAAAMTELLERVRELVAAVTSSCALSDVDAVLSS